MKEFEQIIIKNLLENGTYFNKVFGILKSKYFTDSGCQETFNLIKKYYCDYKQVPNLTELVSLIKDTADEERRKNIAITLKEIRNTENVKNFDFLCNETLSFVKDALYLDALSIGAEGLQKKSDSLKLKAQQILDERAKVTLDDKIGLDYDDIDEMIKYFSEKNIGILSQHKELNKRLGTGFLPGTLSVILAGQSVGKSLFMGDLISGMLLNGKNVLLVSLEMSDFEMMRRIYANTLNIDANAFNDLSKTDGEKRLLDRDPITKDYILKQFNNVKLSGIGKFFVKDYPAGSFTALQLENLVLKYQNEKNIKFDCIFIDYLGIMKSDLVSPSVGLYSYLKSIGEEVRATAKKLNLPIISASQLNRCLDINTIIKTKNGEKYLKDIKRCDLIQTHNGWVKVLNTSKVTLKKTLKIKTARGKTIIVSYDHRIPTNRGLLNAKSLKINDKLVTL